MNNFAKQLKKYRLEKNYSQDTLADQLFISRQAISKWENGDSTPDLENLVKLAEIFDVTLDQLVRGKESTSSLDNENSLENDNLNLLEGREYVINPETGKYEKRDGLTIFIDLVSEYWWLVLFAPIIISFIKLLLF
ncbi:helix-turn-helix domain-containing protein [Streptococcus pseudoporcinus]|uniref:Bacteriophage CI repressor protein n=1 Tax=Streptococcus pseudoporcinus LQ 940-04 TaxID=875093 RepID=G5K7B9_9STRE|nr:helix-turn-helix transcriptional regulator [Streptococcus pseudoporcinus]EFR45210.1 DNA-binding helix-turn-helix protein [Streptococcus pseudoporcinus SPIN 20026]EHI65593.1 bacteriophage CI repressor protein [Streptococcus pseudoporcinus LQ 940-04]VEF93841.1 DNA-binding protein [Streptococcus pseudoporcinus]